jgi:pSer/pThr/pTyr-binding forkhead associated (FHA) protein
MAVLLKIITSTKTIYVEITKDPIVLGRSKDANVVIPDSECSSRHCEIKIHDNVAVIKDLGSKNGTFVNNSVQKETSIYINDEIKIGSTRMYLEPSKMDQQELSLHTLNVPRKETQMINLELVGFSKDKTLNSKRQKAKIISKNQLKKIPQKVEEPWWKKLLSFIFKK